jgi:hypothetical protein
LTFFIESVRNGVFGKSPKFGENMRLFAALSLLPLMLSHAHAQTAPDLLIYPVELQQVALENGETSLKIAVPIPCGSRFFGVLTSETGNVVEVAAVIKRERIVCTGWPDRHSEVIEYVDFGRKQVTAKRVFDLAERVTLGEIRAVAATASGKVVGMMPDVCKKPLGTLARKTEDGLELALVYEKGGESQRGCKLREVAETLPGIRAVGQKLSPLKRKATDIARQFRLRRAPIKPGSIVRNSIKGLGATYSRRCNEAPVGIVLGTPKLNKNGADHAVAVGVLVAEYYNMRCADPEGTRVWDEIFNADLKIPASWNLTELDGVVTAESNRELAVQVPVHVRQGGSVLSPTQQLSLGYFKGCGKIVGSVFSHDNSGRLVAGVLQDTTAARCSVKRGETPAEDALSHPFLSASRKQVLPLRIQGN